MKPSTSENNKNNLSDYHKAAVIKVPVPFRMPGNVIEQVNIDFEVLVNGNLYRAIPLCSKEDKTKTMLPDYIEFERKGGRTIASNKKYQFIADDIAGGLMKKMM